jgi:hypothetical protein
VRVRACACACVRVRVRVCVGELWFFGLALDLGLFGRF